jgi:mRNA-degrading endonuclease toxin of MazEF toxin-antitoxin module
VVVSRPALVVSHGPIGPDGLLLWCAMITNARRPAWPGDIEIPGAVEIGLLIPSKIRTDKLSTIETSAASIITRLDATTLAAVMQSIRARLGA